MTEQTRQSVDDYIHAAKKKPGEFLFIGRHGLGQCVTTRQYARLVSGWVGSIGLDPRLFGTHSLRRTKATRIFALKMVCSRGRNGKSPDPFGLKARHGSQEARLIHVSFQSTLAACPIRNAANRASARAIRAW